MTAALSPVLETWRWPLLALLASGAMLATAHAFEHFAYLLPCPLCLRQREVYWAAIAMAATGLVLWNIRQNRRFLVAFNVMLALVFLTGTVVAAFHAGVEWGWWPAPAGCAVETVDVMNLDLGSIDERTATSSCTDAPWSLFGLSMAGWNALVSLGLALLSFRAATFALPREAV
ncbi:disulfide bond formation protein B [Henriciella aquimarina]|uniref:disulfide bond formation protein B n=1 Tax=Henriciella aquimarina TaxID=545261 RepID=UPI000A062F3E|nr:disulfide bond formation protein B [Henriciella aquimarina]